MSDFKSEVDRELAEVCKLLEIPVLRSWSDKGSQHDFTLRPKELPSPIGLEVRVSDNFLIWHFETSLDSFALPTIQLSREVFSSNRDVVIEYSKKSASRSKEFSFSVNGVDVAELAIDTNWSEFKIEMSRPYESLDFSMQTLRQGLIDILTLISALTRKDEIAGELTIDPDSFKEEGAESVQSCHKYERSRFNREICLSYYGYVCKACGLSLEKKYGEAGLKVIHVHHVTPISLMEGPRVINPINELVPLCPNSHNVAHRRNTPYTVEDLQGFVENNA
jgi:5-methylcytosine-specific restriction protein A